MLRTLGFHAKIFRLSLALLCGCATIIDGPRQNVAVYSNPSTADVWIDGQYVGKTPLHTSLLTDQDHFVRIELPGYQPYEARFTKTVNGWLFGNLLFGGLVGIVIDVATGSMYKLTPKQINAHLRKMGSNHPVADGLHIFVTAKVHSSWEKLNLSLIPVLD